MSSNSSWIDYTNKDYAALREAMLEFARDRVPEWTDHSANDIGVLLVDTFAHMGDLLLYYVDRLVQESYLETAVERRSVVKLLRLIGYELRPPVPASADLTLRFKADSSAAFTIDSGAAFATSAADTEVAIGFRYLGSPISVDLSTLSAEEGEDYKELGQKLPVMQVDRDADEVVGSSDGSPGQRFKLSGAPMIDGTLTVLVDEGATIGAKEWTRVDHFLASGPTAEHFIVRRDADDLAWLEFGNGTKGRIPRRRRNNVRARYLVGGGAKGNVAAQTIIKAIASLPDLEQVFNAKEASGGADRETSEDAATRAPHLYRTQGRAVTTADYEALAREFGVAKVRARAPGWNNIDLYVAPAGGGRPSDLLKRDLIAYFETKRIMTSIVRIKDPDYVRISIRASLEVEPYYFTDQVQQQAENALLALLAFEAVDFQQTLYLSKIYEALERVDGVAATNVEVFARGESETLPPDGRISLAWKEIPFFDGVTWTAVSGGLSSA